MKTCPTCDQIYPDSQSFCLEDGTPLAVVSAESSIETAVLPRKKGKVVPVLFVLFILIGGLIAVGYFLFGGNSNGNQNKQIAANVLNPIATPAVTTSLTQTPVPTPTVSPTQIDNTNSITNSDETQNLPDNGKSSTDNSPPKPVIMKAEDHSILFGLQQCRKSGSSITCELLLTNKGADRNFQFVVYRSHLFDELGNTYEGAGGQVAKENGNNIRIGFINGVTAKAQITFNEIEPNAAKITVLRLQFDVGDDRGLEVKFRNVPLTISK